MLVRTRTNGLVILTLAAVPAVLAASAALQLLSGGIRVRALSPAVVTPLLCVFGAVLVHHRPRFRLGPVLIWNGIATGLGTLAASALDYGAVHPIPRLAAQASFATVSFSRVAVITWVLFILWFPDDRFASRGWRRFAVASAVICTADALAVWLVGPADRVSAFFDGTRVPPGAGGPFGGSWGTIDGLSDLLLLLPLAALGALVQRYRRGDAVIRQQVRWLLMAMVVQVGAQVVASALVAHSGTAEDVGVAIGTVTQPVPMLAATIAILRYRLWEIDLVVSRALVYGVLWAALSALLLVPPLAAGLLVGGRGALAAVGLALLVTAVFQPSRARLEGVAERLVYRHRARPHALLTGFWEAVRTADLDRLGSLLAGAVRDGLGVGWAGAWVYAGGRNGGSLRPLGIAGAQVGLPGVVSAATVDRLGDSPCLVLGGSPDVELDGLWPSPAAVVVPLVVADELVGLLACGPRRGDALGARDFELLELLARESALRLRNLRLEAQLRERLAQIEAQAGELERSRRRLVGAQDEERRRIERNLHDGVQQQLVSLAVRLHRAADGDAVLVDLAAEAEQAVFALQELARGIYPSVLVDQGLPAAVRTQAARLPIAVTVAVDPALAGRRLDPELEAALYFVALEALTNAQKHAPQAAVAVALRADGDRVALEVVDNGPGFDGARPGRGSGLQNMADRMAAADGTFELETRAGAGTRIAAAVPAGEALLQADSRR